MHLRSTSLFAFGAVGAAAIDLLPGPGPYGTSLATTNFTDYSRIDPYARHRTARNLMVSVFGPVPRHENSNVSIPYMPALSAAFYDQTYQPLTTNGTFESMHMTVSNLKRTKGKQKHSAQSRICGQAAKFPLLVFSPGAGNSRLIYNSLAQSVASYGYYVLLIDHPYDALAIEYPDDSLVLAANFTTDEDYAAAMKVRALDVQSLANGLSTSEALRQILPPDSVDVQDMYIAGHSLGGATALSVMLGDERFKAGVNLDGKFFPQVWPRGARITKPFLLVGNSDRNASTDETWQLALKQNIRGPRAELQISGWEHGTFTDLPFLLANAGFDGYVDGLGSVEGVRARQVLTNLLVTFLAASRRGSDLKSLRNVSAEFPEVKIVSTKGI